MKKTKEQLKKDFDKMFPPTFPQFDYQKSTGYLARGVHSGTCLRMANASEQQIIRQMESLLK